MLPNTLAPAIESAAFPVVRIPPLSLYFCSCHVRIRHNQVRYDGYSAGKEESVL